MSIHFYPLNIKEIRKETEDCVSVEFEIPEALKEAFRFNQGQSLTMRTFLNGDEVRRTYSICSSPLENEWRVAIKKIEGGLFSTFANEQIKKGDMLDVMQPVGKFYTLLDPTQKKNYVAFAAGSGITPVISIIQTTLQTEPRSNFTLVYGNRNKNSIIFKEKLEGLKDRYLDRFCIYYILSREKTELSINSGRIDVKKLIELSKLIDYNQTDEFFICGPEQMIFNVKEFLEQKDIPKRKIHFELFTTPGEKKSVVKSQESVVVTEIGPKSKISIKLDGAMYDFELGFSSDSILDAALKQGADLPFSCKGGVCTTCKAKLVKGEVEMDVHWGLEPDEIEQGFILTCQSHPKTERVIIDFDTK